MWLVRPGAAPLAEREPLSGFLVQFSLFEAIAAGPAQAYAWSAPATVDVTSGLHPVPLEPWQWPDDPTRYFVGPDLVLCTSAVGADEITVLAGARTPSALASLSVQWDVLND